MKVIFRVIIQEIKFHFVGWNIGKAIIVPFRIMVEWIRLHV
jgi:hypothetical protein